MPLYIQYPSWITPEIFPGVPVLGMVRWYGLMYIFAFATAYFVFKRFVQKGEIDASTDEVYSFFTFSILCLILGARIFYTLVYDPSGYYRQKPWRIFWPFDEAGNFTGLAGMSYHGGALGGFVGMVLWCVLHKKNALKWIDGMAIAIPLGYTFGRLGNFFNAELYGRITTMPWGMVFPDAERYSLSLDWVRSVVDAINLPVQHGTVMVNLPRHPSQLYEAFFEGIVLWAVLTLVRKKKPFTGLLTGLYFALYGVIRFIIEYFREPDSDMGYKFASVADAPLARNVSLLNISTGQVLCFCMIVGGLAIIVASYLYTLHQSRQAHGQQAHQ